MAMKTARAQVNGTRRNLTYNSGNRAVLAVGGGNGTDVRVGKEAV